MIEPLRQSFRPVTRSFIQTQYLGSPITECILLDVSHSKLGKHFGNIIDEHTVRRKNNHFLRGNLLFVLVQQVSQPMESNSRLPAPCHTLDDQRAVPARTNNLILLSLNCGDNVPKLIVLVLSQPIEQEFIRHSRSFFFRVKRIDHPFKDLLANHDVALQVDESFDQPFRRLIRGRIPPGKRIEQAGYRSSPVNDHGLCGISAYAYLTYVQGGPCSALLFEIKPSEIRLLPRLGQLSSLSIPPRFQHLLGIVMSRIHRDAAQSIQFLVYRVQGAVQPRLLFLIGTLKIFHFSYLLR
ncbi:hypothetical protein D3C86_1085170 [compost metagenome]